MLTFYLIAGGAALVSAVLLVRPLIMGRGDAVGQADTDAQVFKDQLAEIDRDLDRGTITEAEAEGARIEVSRRLLSANARARKTAALTPAPQGHSGLVAGLALMGTPALAAALYFGIGAPGMQDQPLQERRAQTGAQQQQMPANHPALNRPTQEEAEARIAAEMPPAPQPDDPEYTALVERLEGVVETQPEDAQGRRLLADGLMRLGRYDEAWRHYQTLIELLGPQATADLYATMAEGMVLATGGYVSPEAENAITRSLQLDQTLPIGRYYAGLALRQAGRLDDAIAMWEGLRQDSPADAPYLEWLNMMLAETIRVRDGTPAPGPTQDQMAAAEDMSPQDRMEMIQGMVSGLNERLTTQGGTPEEWARLMSSYATLNQTEDAMRVYELASAAYPSGEEGVQLYQHATRLGLTVTAATAPPGPTQEDIEAAGQMSPEDRNDMILGMVERLEDRLTSDGGAAEEWLRLIRSYVQLDRRDDAARIFRLADAELSAKSDPSRGFVKEQTLLMGVPVE